MISQKNIEKIKKIVKEFFEKMTFEVEIDVLPQRDLTLPINLKTEEPQILIGQGGETLSEIQRLLKAILRRQLFKENVSQIVKEDKSSFPPFAAARIVKEDKSSFPPFAADRVADGEPKQENFYIDLDVNDYKKKKSEYLRELARDTANDVVLTKKEKMLEPMPAYERRVIHLELAGRTDVASESVGQEPERRVVIKPFP